MKLNICVLAQLTPTEKLSNWIKFSLRELIAIFKANYLSLIYSSYNLVITNNIKVLL